MYKPARRLRIVVTSVNYKVRCVLIEPRVFGDERGFFLESFNQRAFNQATGLDLHFVQDNHSRSARNVLRGLHYQTVQPQGKLVRVVSGEVFDVAVDIRPQSPTYGLWAGELLSGANKRQLWVPPGLAHGFLVLSETADFLYKTTDYYAPEYERCIAWNVTPAAGFGNVLHCTNIDQTHRHHAHSAPSGCHLASTWQRPAQQINWQTLAQRGLAADCQPLAQLLLAALAIAVTQDCREVSCRRSSSAWRLLCLRC